MGRRVAECKQRPCQRGEHLSIGEWLNNTDANNPGYLINLAMKHAMAMVSFQCTMVAASDNDVNFTKFEIQEPSKQLNLLKPEPARWRWQMAQ